ncbi:hypothetical protein [Phenylobacterium sp.]|uniref:hypothetical protein n=1 Tax=Phenylobacterium sp. TaxID=1871053 RepID=UPI00356B41C9
MKARITFNMSEDGELEIWLNAAGRDLLVRELQGLNEKWDHFHFGPEDMAEVEVSSIAYRATDTLLEWGKILFRPDEWDADYYPHVLQPPEKPTAS